MDYSIVVVVAALLSILLPICVLLFKWRGPILMIFIRFLVEDGVGYAEKLYKSSTGAERLVVAQEAIKDLMKDYGLDYDKYSVSIGIIIQAMVNKLPKTHT